MPELDDDKTDKLFQVGADRHDFTYDPAAWEQMEGLLDADDLLRNRFNWLLALGGLLLLLVLVLAWFNVGGSQVSEDIAPVPAQAEKLAGEKSPEATVRATLPPQSAANEETKSVANAFTSAPDNEIAPVSLSHDARLAGSNNREELPARNPTKNEIAKAANLPSPNATQGNGMGDLPEPSLPVIFNDEEEILVEAEAIENAIQKTTFVVNQLPRQAIGLLEYTRDKAEVTIVPGQEVPTFEALGQNTGFAVGVSAGFAAGKTRTGSLSAPRFRFGGRLDYRLNNRFSLGTGAFLTKVDYQSDGKEYKADEDFWLYDVVPANVKADCDILEIPLSLTWHPHGNNQSGIYFGAGLTSYFMLTEKFAFEYDVPDDELIKGWREDNTNEHLMGMGQISFGFQRKAGQRSALQFESFIQLPLTGIGHGGVNLMTVGASVNYTFDFRKRR